MSSVPLVLLLQVRPRVRVVCGSCEDMRLQTGGNGAGRGTASPGNARLSAFIRPPVGTLELGILMLADRRLSGTRGHPVPRRPDGAGVMLRARAPGLEAGHATRTRMGLECQSSGGALAKAAAA